MALTAGMGPLEIADAFEEAGDPDDRDLITREIHFLAGIFLRGRIQTYTRLAGGGDPIKLPASAWESDDPVARFSTASLNVDRPHDPSAEATHWIFVDDAQWDAAMHGLRQSRLEPLNNVHEIEIDEEERLAVTVDHLPESTSTSVPAVGVQRTDERWRNEILTMDNVEGVTGLKRSTIYAKMAAGSFPQRIPIHGTRKGWRRGEIQDWLDALPS
jgi:prophage regulatory protein